MKIVFETIYTPKDYKGGNETFKRKIKKIKKINTLECDLERNIRILKDNTCKKPGKNAYNNDHFYLEVVRKIYQ